MAASCSPWGGDGCGRGGGGPRARRASDSRTSSGCSALARRPAGLGWPGSARSGSRRATGRRIWSDGRGGAPDPGGVGGGGGARARGDLGRRWAAPLPGTDGRAVGAAVQEYVARPLLEELAAACEGWDALPPPAAPPRVRRAATVPTPAAPWRKRAPWNCSSAPPSARIRAGGGGPRWRPSSPSGSRRGRSELWDGLPGRVVREVRQNGRPAGRGRDRRGNGRPRAGRARRGRPAPVVIGPAPSTNGTRHILKEALP
jgi:hypothetical protein